MKKAVSILLAAALILCMGVPVYAESITADQGSASSPVTGTYVPGTAGGTVFSVEITWSDLSFTYNGESKQVWDPDTLEYTGEARSAGWAESNAAITVKNRSNTIITATPSYEKAAGFDAGMEFAVKELYVLSAEPTGEVTKGDEKSGTISVKPTGTLPENTQNTTIGTITVTIGEFEDVTEQDVLDLYDYIQAELFANYYVTADQIESLPAGRQYCDPEQLAEIAERQDILDTDFDTLSQDERNQQYIEVWDLINQLEILTKE